MLNIKRVLVPTDFSPPCEAAFTYACALAVQFQSISTIERSRVSWAAS